MSVSTPIPPSTYQQLLSFYNDITDLIEAQQRFEQQLGRLKTEVDTAGRLVSKVSQDITTANFPDFKTFERVQAVFKAASERFSAFETAGSKVLLDPYLKIIKEFKSNMDGWVLSIAKMDQTTLDKYFQDPSFLNKISGLIKVHSEKFAVISEAFKKTGGELVALSAELNGIVSEVKT